MAAAQVCMSQSLLAGRHHVAVRPMHSSPRLGTAQRQRGVQVYAKGKGKQRFRNVPGQMAMQKPPTPPVDPDNEEFVIFIRPKKLPKWLPFSIVKGGAQANLLVKASSGKLEDNMYSNALVRNIGAALYRDKDAMIREIRKVPTFKPFTEFEFGFKIRDKENPEKWFEATDVCLIPPESELPSTPVDNLKEFVGDASNQLQRGLSSLGGIFNRNKVAS